MQNEEFDEEGYVDVNSLPLRPPQPMIPPEKAVRRPWHPVMWDDSLIGIHASDHRDTDEEVNPARIYNYADVNKFLSKMDFIEMIRTHLKWPWSLTHFIFCSRCYGCGSQIVRENRPLHFVLTYNNVNNLLRYGLFWSSFLVEVSSLSTLSLVPSLTCITSNYNYMNIMPLCIRKRARPLCLEA